MSLEMNDAAACNEFKREAVFLFTVQKKKIKNRFFLMPLTCSLYALIKNHSTDLLSSIYLGFNIFKNRRIIMHISWLVLIVIRVQFITFPRSILTCKERTTWPVSINQIESKLITSIFWFWHTCNVRIKMLSMSSRPGRKNINEVHGFVTL